MYKVVNQKRKSLCLVSGYRSTLGIYCLIEEPVISRHAKFHNDRRIGWECDQNKSTNFGNIIAHRSLFSPVWSPCTVTDVTKIESVQRSFTKRLPGLSNLVYTKRLDVLGDGLELRRLHYDLVFVYKMPFGAC